MHDILFVCHKKNSKIYSAFAKARALTKKKNSRSRCDAVLKAILHMSRSKRKKRAFACACCLYTMYSTILRGRYSLNI